MYLPIIYDVPHCLKYPILSKEGFAKEYLLTKPLKLQDSRHSMKSILNEYKAIVGRGNDPVVIDPHVANIVKGVSGK